MLGSWQMSLGLSVVGRPWVECKAMGFTSKSIIFKVQQKIWGGRGILPEEGKRKRWVGVLV